MSNTVQVFLAIIGAIGAFAASVGGAFLTARAMIRANSQAAGAERYKVDAGAYERAQKIEAGVILMLQEQVKRQAAELEDVRNELQTDRKARERVERDLRISENKVIGLEAEIRTLRAQLNSR